MLLNSVLNNNKQTGCKFSRRNKKPLFPTLAVITPKPK